MICYFFGCYRREGHHLWDKHYQSQWILLDLILWSKVPLDAGLAPDLLGEPEGVASRHVFAINQQTWTAVAFWDRSVDSRGRSNSAFLVPGDVPFDDVIKAAQETFPDVWARFKFPIVEYTGAPA